MIIHSLHLASFGKFKDKTISFGEGINYIYGENEAGKSTVMAFIKAMLYGFTGRGADGDRKRYIPWDGAVLSGEMTVTLHDGRHIIISRTSGKTPAQDQCKILDALTGEVCDVDLEAEIGIGENAFLKTVCIRQLGASLDGGDEELTDKLINLTGGGTGDTGYEDAIEVLKEGIRLYRHQRGDGGRIHELKKELTALSAEIEEAKTESQKYKGYEEEEKALRQEVETLTKREKELEKAILAGRAGLACRALEEAEKRVRGLKDGLSETENAHVALLEKIKTFPELDGEAAILYAPPENPAPLRASAKSAGVYKGIWFALAGISALAAAAFLSLKSVGIGAVALGLAIVFALFGGLQAKTKTRLLKEIGILEEKEAEKHRILSLTGCSSLQEYTQKKAEKLATAEKIKALEEKRILLAEEVRLAEEETRARQKEVESFGDIPPQAIDISAAEAEMTRVRTALSEKTQKAATLSGVLQGGRAGKKSVDILLSQQSCLLEELAEAEENLAALQLAAETLETVFAEVSRDFTPRISEKASRYLSVLTGNPEETLLIDKKYAVTLGRGTHRPLKAFSGGTMDQAFLAVRLAMAELVLKDKNMPILLDDAFLQYDAQREENAIRLLGEIARGRQILWFSCRMRETKDTNRIEL